MTPTFRTRAFKSKKHHHTAAIPRWLRPISQLYAAFQDDDDKATTASFPPGAPPPPLCVSDRSKDVELMYRTLAYWCVDFANAPEHFIRSWFGHGTAEVRAQLLATVGAFRSELDEELWVPNMIKRDDVRMLVAVMPTMRRYEHLLNMVDGMIVLCMEFDADRCFDMLLDQFPALATSEWLHAAARHGRVRMFQDLMRRHGAGATPDHLQLSSDTLVRRSILNAARGGQVAMLQYLHAHFPGIIAHDGQVSAYFSQAARYGHLDALLWLRMTTQPLLRGALLNSCEYGAYAGAVAGSRLDVLEWLCDNEWASAHTDDADLLMEAADRGDRRILQWLADHGTVLEHKPILIWAAVNSRTIPDGPQLRDLLDWLYDVHNCTPRMKMCITAANERNRGPDTIQWIMARGR